MILDHHERVEQAFADVRAADDAASRREAPARTISITRTRKSPE